MLRERLLLKAVAFLVSVIVFVYAFEGIWAAKTVVPYALVGVMSVAIVLFCMIYGHLYRNTDTLLWSVFFSLALISTIINLGISPHFFISRFFCTWMMFVAVYYAVQIVPDHKDFLSRVFGVYALALTIACVYILAKATASLCLEKPAQDILRGCFKAGRLCGMYNANTLGFSCVSLIISSVFTYLNSQKRVRIIFLITGFVGWFCLGLTGCRTGMIGVCLAIGILVFSMLYTGSIKLKFRRIKYPAVASFLISLFAFLFALESFLLPVHLYQFTVTAYAKLTGQQYLIENAAALVVRRIFDDDGTLSDRTRIWPQGLRMCFQTPRRFLIGISPISKDFVTGVYEGRHDIMAVHAHNTYIELLRKHGVLGFITFMTMLIIWSRQGFKILFRGKETAAFRYLVASAAALLIMGFAESIPFYYMSFCYTSIPFFLTCGYCYRVRSEV